MSPLDGLSALKAKRDEATKSARHLPPPRRTKSPDAASDDLPSASGEPPTASPKARTARQPRTKTPATPEPSEQASAVQLASEPRGGGRASTPTDPVTALIRSTIYLGDADDAWLQEISSIGRGRRPKVDASRSAVVRLALDRLRAQMTQDQVVALLSARAEASVQAVGRKRL